MLPQTRITSLDLPLLARHFVGVDRLFDDLERSFGNSLTRNDNYPPYNIVKHDEDHYAIEVAVAGFSEKEIDVSLEGAILTIKGVQEEVKEDVQKDYIHRGISSRSFERRITLGDHIVVKEARVENGLLTVSLERIIPEEFKPRKIPVKFSK